jgi:hypothetical protein
MWFDGGFRQERTEAWEGWLKASKIRWPASAIFQQQSHWMPLSRGIHRWIRPRVGGWVKELNGKAFDRLCDLIA